MLVKLIDVDYTVPSGEEVYKKLNLELYLGDFVGVLGKNGAGKTTLMDLLMGFRPITSGSISIIGEDPMAAHRRRKHEIFTLSHDIKIQPSHKIRNYLDFTSFFYPEYSAEKERRVLDFLELEERTKFGALSTGQKVKAQIAAAFASGAKLILMDEVTAVLDPESRKKFFMLLRELKRKQSCSVIMATNIAEDLNGIVDRVLFIDNKSARIHPVEDIRHLFNLEEKDVA